MKQSIPNKKKKKLFDQLSEANIKFQKIYPGDRSERQPVHTVYGGANLFKYNSAQTLAQRALEGFQTYASDFVTFGRVFGLKGIDEINGTHEMIQQEYESLSADEKRNYPARLSYEVYHKVMHKLKT